MKIKHILEAVQLESLDPERFDTALIDAWERLRFRQPPQGYQGSDRLGAALLGTNNFAWKSSGWFDEGAITFPAALLPKTHDEITAHLEWMIDCRRNADVLEYIWKAISDVLPRRFQEKGFVWRLSRAELAKQVNALWAEEPLLAKAMLAGRFWRASALIAKKHKALLKRGHLNTLVHLAILWGLFDLQVVAYRLFHAEWNPTDAGMDHPEKLTLESFEACCREVSKMANLAAAAFAAGKGLSDADPDLSRFIAENDIEDMAKANAARLGITSAALQNDDAVQRSIEASLTAFQSKLLPLATLFAKRSYRPRLTVTGYGSHAAGVSKGKFKSLPGKSARGLEIKQPVATVRFSLPAMAAILYAVESMVTQLGNLPAGGKIVRDADGRYSGAKMLLLPQKRKQLVTSLFTIYRDLFVRSAHNSSDEVVGSEHKILAREAMAATQDGNEDPGLEPLLPEWESRPFRPLLPGVSPRRQLAYGRNEVSDDETDPQDPAKWRAKRIASERLQETAAVRYLRDDQSERRHFHERAKGIDRQFGVGTDRRITGPRKVSETP